MIDTAHSFLPDVEILGVDQLTLPNRLALKGCINGLKADQVGDLMMTNLNTTETPGELADQIVHNAFRKNFCNELFDFLGGFVG